MDNYVELSGNNFEIGEQLGRFWGNYFQEQRKKNSYAIIQCYPKWLQDADYNDGLFKNIENNFPDIVEEIAGLAEGINNSKLKLTRKVTRENVFARCLWEEKRSCTSAIFKKKNGYLLCHNLEDDPHSDCIDGIFPLCLSKVNLTGGGKEQSFISISYPFSLLGTCGINQHLAYQGNTIGDKGRTTTKSWHKRIPAMVFQRKLLEMTSKAEIENFLNKHYMTMPGHNYIVFHDKAYSLEVRPTNITELPAQQYSLVLREDDFHTHTNYFRNTRQQIDRDWLYPDEQSDEKIFDWRFDRLYEFAEKYSNKNITDQEIQKYFISFACVNQKYTSASLFFDNSARKKRCRGLLYFDAKKNFKVYLE